MKEYVFLRINEKFNCLFSNNLSAFLELYYRKEESVFYMEQFKLFLEKNKQKEIITYIKNKLTDREDFIIDNNKLSINNKFDETKEELELLDNYLIINGNFKKSIFGRYLCEYDSSFLVIDTNNNKIERISLVN